MRLLFIANASSPLVQNLAIELKRCRPGLVIDIISDNKPPSTAASGAFDRIIAPSGGRWLRRTRGVKFLWFAWQHRRSLTRSSGGYDAVHLFYLSAIWGALANRLRSKAPRMLITLFGSDVYRSFWPLTWFQKRLLMRADRYTTSNPHTVGFARELFDLDLLPCDELLFGLRSLEHMRDLRAEFRDGSRQLLGIDPESVVVACGYNGSSNQNHAAILKAVEGLPKELRDRLFLLLPMTSGGSMSYLRGIEAQLVDLGVPYRVFTSRLDDLDVARIRMATDILVQVQKTDQLSGSMIEHLYAGNVLLTGAWLPYALLTEHKLRYWTTSSLDQLGADLFKCISELETRRIMCAGNREIVWGLTAWERTAPRWSALYGA